MTDTEFYLKRSVILWEIIAWICSVITAKNNKGLSIKVIVFYLTITVVIETMQLIPIIIWRYPEIGFSIFMKEKLHLTFPFLLKNTIWLGSLYSLLTFYSYLFFYKYIIDQKKIKDIISILIILYTFFVGVSLYHYERLFDSWLGPHMYAGVLLILCAIFLYLLEILKSDKILTFYKTLPFWITMGILFFNLVTMPIFIFAEHLHFSSSVYVYILVISNYIMYGCFITGFIINARGQRKLQ